MALQQSKLEALFAGPPVPTEPEAIDFMAGAFTDFFSDATVVGAPAVLATLVAPSGPEDQMRAALVGISAPNAGAAKLQAGMTAYWTAAMLVAPTVWPTAAPPIVPGSGIVPPGLGTLGASLAPVFAQNIATSADSATASAALGAAIIAAMSGATVLLSPGTNPPVPVL